MAQTIKLRRSAVAGNRPTTGQLDLGELAINTVDGRFILKGLHLLLKLFKKYSPQTHKIVGH
jgi:hypothetical protein